MIKIVFNKGYDQLRLFINALPDTFDQLGDVIYDKRNQIRVMEVNDVTLNVKRYCVPKWYNRLIYSFIRKPKAERAYDNALKLLELEVSTPEPVAYIIEKNPVGIIKHSYLVTKQSGLSRTFYEFGYNGVAGREDIIKALAVYSAKLHDRGIYHKDYSPGNILFDKTGNEICFSLVDINRMRFGIVDMEDGCANFARLWGQKPFFEILAREYAKARGFEEKECFRIIMSYRKKFWLRYERRHPVMFELGEL